MPVFIVLSLAFFIAAGGTEKQKEKAFAWSMALQNTRNGELVNFSAPVKSWNGEKFRLIINPEADCYCYVIAESADEEIAVLQAGPLQGREAWFSSEIALSPPKGSETLFVIASRGEQSSLSRVISAFKSSPGAAPRRALMSEVYRIRSENSQFREIPGKPVLIGGVARGTPGRDNAMEFSGMNTYVKTISLEH